MRFEVIGPDGKTKMVTWHEECIPYKDQLEELSELGYTFKKDGKIFKVEVQHQKSEDIVKNTTSIKRTSRTVMCIETGIVYPTQSAAAQDCGLDPAYVSDSVKTGKTYKGFTFKRVQ